MAKLNYFLLSENFILDTKGHVTVVNMFNHLNSTGKVAVPTKFTLVIGVTPDEKEKSSEAKFRIQILKPDGSEHLKIDGGGAVPEEKIGRLIVSSLDLSGKIQFDQEGEYLAKLFFNGKKQAELGFNVSLNQKTES